LIKARFHRSKTGKFYGFDVRGHGDPAVCAAVSALSVNCVNSIEAFTRLTAKTERLGSGSLSLTLPEIQNGGESAEAGLLLESLLLGLRHIMEEHPKDLRVLV
jgi:uncharacterized protein YsxB (DUF464 family)